MKTSLFSFPAASAALAAAALGAAVAFSQTDRRVESVAAPSAQALAEAWPDQPVLASSIPAGTPAEDLTGRDVVTADGEELGRLRELVVDLNTGRVVYVLVGSGGLFGIGEERRIVPMQALTRGASGSVALRLTTPMSDEQWEHAPRYSNDELSLLAQAATQQRIEAHFQVDAVATEGADATTSESLPVAQLVLASELRGMEVRSEDGRVGQVDAVLVLVEAGEALVRLDPDAAATRTNEQFLIVLSKLRPHQDEEKVLQTDFALADFQRAIPSIAPGLDPAAVTE